MRLKKVNIFLVIIAFILGQSALWLAHGAVEVVRQALLVKGVFTMEQQQLVQLSARALGQARAQADTTEAVLVDSYTSHLQRYLLLVQAEVVGDKNFLTTLLNGNLDNRQIYQN